MISGDSKYKIELVKYFMQLRGMNHLYELAKRMDLKPNTLTNNLRYMVSSGSYGSKFAVSLFQTLGVDKETFFDAVEKGVLELEDDSLSKIEEKGQFFNEAASTYQKEILEQIRALNEGDFYTLITTERPWEFDDIEMRQHILNAVKSGAKFRYLYPKPNEFTESYFNNYEGSIDWDSLWDSHKRYVKLMIRLAKEDDDFSENIDFSSNLEGSISERLKAYLVDDLWLVNTFHKYIILERQDFGGVHQIAFVEARFSESQNGMNNEQNSFWIPMPKNDRIRLIKNVERVII